MRDGHVSVAAPGARPSLKLLLALKREFAFYSIDVCSKLLAMPAQSEEVFVMGGCDDVDDNEPERFDARSSMERYEATTPTTGRWVKAQSMCTKRCYFGTCVTDGDLYVTGGLNENNVRLKSVEKYSRASDTWSAVASLPNVRSSHAAVAVGSTMYVLGGVFDDVAGGGFDGFEENAVASVLKFDSTQGTWSEVASLPSARVGLAACSVGNNIYVFGGWFTHKHKMRST
jgi:N-acetylneuraminic acid mutarotase